jgi:hypothetical protein|tara:strand:+ start:65560 stop:65907 length:348 start_codon:yes stop_codon:yes gene_type:complete
MRMSKYYNTNDLCSELSQLASFKASICRGDPISNLLAIEKATGDDVVTILQQVGYALKDVVAYCIFKKAAFTVWVGGIEISDYYVDLKKASEIYQYWKMVKKHDDVAICVAKSQK